VLCGPILSRLRRDYRHSVAFATTESYGRKHPKGGWQGGRGWEDTDHTPQNESYFGGGGGWHIENFFEAMDEENEWCRLRSTLVSNRC
jgi:hypothetical protein